MSETPMFEKPRFNCPHCSAFAQQNWYPLKIFEGNYSSFFSAYGSICVSCTKGSIWLDKKLVYPAATTCPPPAGDMPEEARKVYIEAATVFNSSARASAALLRLALQILCKEIGGTGHNINDDIAEFVAQKLIPPSVQKAMDVVRVVGNNAVHPGTIDINDNPTVAIKLFKLINIIVETCITTQNEITDLFDELPTNSKAAIEKRDTSNNSQN